mgnify:CR=1 FL=1
MGKKIKRETRGWGKRIKGHRTIYTPAIITNQSTDTSSATIQDWWATPHYYYKVKARGTY